MTRLPPHPGELIDRSEEFEFFYRGKPVRAFHGDTFGSALYASGMRVFSRSFKYHRPRGLLCCSGHCANCQMTVDGEPNVRVCVTPAREGAVVKGQNYVGSLERDLMQVTDKLGGPFTPPGFYYKTFIRPRKLWPLYEKMLRGVAGLGKIDPEGARKERIEVVHEHVDVLVIGGGEAGLEAATEAATGGRRVMVVDEGPDVGGTLLADRDRSRTSGRATAARARGGRRAPRACGRDRDLRVRLRPRCPWRHAPQDPCSAHRRRDRRDRAAARLPRQRSRRRDAARRRAPSRQPVVGQAGRAGLRRHGRRPRGGGRLRPDRRRRRGRRRPRSPRRAATERRGPRTSWAGRGVRGQRPGHGLRPRRDVREYAAELQAARAGGRTRHVRRRARRLRADRPPSERRSGGRRRRRCRRAGGADAGPRLPGRQVLRLLLRGPDEEGPDVRDRRGVRLDRALQALHDGDDGPVPGAALPPGLDPRLREGHGARRGRDRHHDGAAAALARDPRAAGGAAAGAGEANRAPPPPRGSRGNDDVDGRVEAAALVRPGSRRRGPARAPRRRPDRRLDARQDPRHRP